jgi:serine acetyltransferase
MLSEPTIRPESAPAAWQLPDPTAPVPFWTNLYEDALAHVPPEMRPSSPWRRYCLLLWVAITSSGFHATSLYRLAHAARAKLGFIGKPFGFALYWFLRHAYTCTISPAARLHGGLILPHPQGLVIGADVVVGPRTWLYQNVTLGGAPGKVGMPFVGADARIFTGAVLSGPIRLGDNVVIAANAVVWRDVPSRTMVRPAEMVSRPLPDALPDGQP